MDYKILNICIILITISLISLAIMFAYKNLYYDPSNEWKLVSDENNNIFISKNKGEFICNLYTNTSNMIPKKWVNTHCDNY